MGIDLGLRRVVRLLGLLGDPHKASWYALHVAGTNGKGSVCAYLSSVFCAARIPNGRFTSPHLLDRWDAITINGAAVPESVFKRVEKTVRDADKSHGVGATEFELLTVTAYEIFRREKVRVAVIEVGLGGRLDATNVLVPCEDTSAQDYGVIATVITKIGLDHQSFLGFTLGQIAKEKAGIIKPFVPCIVDGSNDKEVMDVVRKVAEENGSFLKESVPIPVKDSSFIETSNFGVIDTKISPLKGLYQASNLGCAANTLSRIAHTFPELTREQVLLGIKETKWPGRLQSLEVKLDVPINGQEAVPVLLDGAHNNQAAERLAEYIDTTIRTKERPNVHFIVAFTKGKDFSGILKRVLHSGDSVVATEFGGVDGMPWISSHTSEETAAVSEKVLGAPVSTAPNVQAAVTQTVQRKPSNPIVIFGSLYLASEVLRWQR